MTRYWIIAPIESDPTEVFNKVWKFDLANNLISIGWARLGDISKMSKEEIAHTIAAAYPKNRPQWNGRLTNIIWSFYHEISLGDFILARRGRKTLAAVGKVTKSAVYSPNRNPYCDHPHFLEVLWQESPQEKTFSNLVFPRQTLREISETEYRQFVEEPVNDPVLVRSENAKAIGEIEEIEDIQSFGLEKYLEEFIVANFKTIFKGELTIYEDEDGNGQQYDTEKVGVIDILAKESNSESFVVIELKKGRSSDQVIGQILRYMGWVKENLCDKGQQVKGLIICRDPDPKLSYALAMTKDIEVQYYTVSFKLTKSERSHNN